MKRKFHLILLLSFLGVLFCIQNVHSQSCMDLYRAASELQKKKQWEDAIKAYGRAAECDPRLKADCEREIKKCKNAMDNVTLSESTIYIPYQGGDKQIKVNASKKWEVRDNSDTTWCKVPSVSKKNLVISCLKPNNSVKEKLTTLTIKCGTAVKTLRVIQAARPAFLEVSSKNIAFPAEGTSELIGVDSNIEWDVTSYPSWCNIEKVDSGIVVKANPNKWSTERVEDIVIKSAAQTIVVKIYQGAGNEKLLLSHNYLSLDAQGDKQYVKVYTDAEHWFIGDFPTWLNVQRMGKDSLCIQVGKNIPNGETRGGTVQVKTDRQTIGVHVSQMSRMPQDIIFHDKIVSGRNISFGVNAAYLIPMISASSGGDYTGSVVNYGLCNKNENASYKSATGYTFGAFADIRLYKNIFLTTGLNYTHVGYSNSFNSPIKEFRVSGTKDYYLKGEVMNSYKEDYSFSTLELPIIASYRFKINDVSHVQLNVGPVVSYGLSARLKLSGTTSSQELYQYSSKTHMKLSDSRYLYNTKIDQEFDLYKDNVQWEKTSTTGNSAGFSDRQLFQDAPFKRLNFGLNLGAAYEIAGLSFSLSYQLMLTNMANKGYWDSARWTILNEGDKEMSGYKHRIHSLQLKLAYTLRYF